MQFWFVAESGRHTRSNKPGKGEYRMVEDSSKGGSASACLCLGLGLVPGIDSLSPLATSTQRISAYEALRSKFAAGHSYSAAIV